MVNVKYVRLNMYMCVNMGKSYGEHLEQLQPIGGPAFLSLVHGQRELHIPGILGEQ